MIATIYGGKMSRVELHFAWLTFEQETSIDPPSKRKIIRL